MHANYCYTYKFRAIARKATETSVGVFGSRVQFNCVAPNRAVADALFSSYYSGLCWSSDQVEMEEVTQVEIQAMATNVYFKPGVEW